MDSKSRTEQVITPRKINNGNKLESKTTPLPPWVAQSYIAIFEDGLDQLAVLADIEPDVSKTNAKPLGEEITRILRDQKALEQRYAELVREQEKLKALPNKTKYKEGKMAIQDIASELGQSTQALAKNLKSHPSVSQNLIKIQSERSSLQTLLSKTIRELKEMRFDSLDHTVDEDYKKKNTLQNMINSENESAELLKQLQKQLTNEKKLLEEELAERNQVIHQLKDTIQEISALTLSEQKYIRKETKAHEMSVKQRCQTKEVDLEKERQKVLLQQELEERAHEKIVDFLTRQREELDLQIQDWMTKYEEDTEAKATELESMKQRRTTDLEKFEKLVVAYEELERIVEEDRLNKQKEAEEQRVKAMIDLAVRRIQRWWKRLMLARAEVAAKNSKGKKGGKNAKGKKK